VKRMESITPVFVVKAALLLAGTKQRASNKLAQHP